MYYIFCHVLLEKEYKVLKKRYIQYICIMQDIVYIYILCLSHFLKTLIKLF